MEQERHYSHKKLDLSNYDLTEEKSQEILAELLDGPLRPYENDEYLTQRLYGQNRLLRNAPELKGQIKQSLLADDDESILSTVEHLSEVRHNTAPSKERPINTLLSYFTLVKAIQEESQIVPQDRAERAYYRANAIASLYAAEIAQSFPIDQLDEALITSEYALERLRILRTDKKDGISPTFESKLLVLLPEINRRSMVSRYLEALPGNDTELVDSEVVERDSESISGLFGMMKATQRYGVSPGYIVDEQRGGSLIFNPPTDLRKAFKTNSHSLVLQTNAVAEVTHSRKEKHQGRIRPKVVHADYEADVVTGTLDIGDLDPLAPMNLGPDGELYLDRQCTAPIADMARVQGKYGAYRDLQATVLAHYYDLTHPFGEAREIQSTSQISSHESPAHPLNAIGRLVIPRIQRHLLRSPHEQQETPPERSIRRHNVTWHVRKLPSGWSASPDALALATELGVRLEPGETIVREHERGSQKLGEAAARRLIKRPSTNR